MRWYKTTALTVGLLALGCQSTPTLTSTMINVATDQIEDRIRDWERYVNNGAVDSLLSVYYPNEQFTYGWTSGLRTRGIEQHSAETREYFTGIQFANINVQSPSVDVISENVAAVYFRYSIDVVLNDTSRDPYSGLGLQVWMKDPEDDRWKIQHHMMSRNER